MNASMVSESHVPGAVRQMEQRRCPPLRIHHLFIWTTLTAAIITGCMSFDRWMRNGPPIHSPVIIGGLMLGAIVLAGAFTIVGSAYSWRRHGYVYPQAPGDWLLTILTTSSVFVFAAFAVFLAVFFAIGDDDWFIGYYILAGGAVLIEWERLQFAGYKYYADTASWRFAFSALMHAPLAIFLSSLHPSVATTSVVAISACVTWGAYNDWRSRIARPWTHWSGVALAVLCGISMICVSRG